MTAPLNYSVFPLQRPIARVFNNGAFFSVPADQTKTRYITRIVFDNTRIDYATDLLPTAPWDNVSATLRWQLFVGNADDRASLTQFGLFADQGSVEFASPVQIQPGNFFVVTILDVKPASISKLSVIIHLAGTQ